MPQGFEFAGFIHIFHHIKERLNIAQGWEFKKRKILSTKKKKTIQEEKKENTLSTEKHSKIQEKKKTNTQTTMEKIRNPAIEQRKKQVLRSYFFKIPTSQAIASLPARRVVYIHLLYYYILTGIQIIYHAYIHKIHVITNKA